MPDQTPTPSPKKSRPPVRVSTRGRAAHDALRDRDPATAAEIIRRRLEGPSPFTSGGSRAIALTDPSLLCRWFNGEKSPDHIWRAQSALGWVPVTPDQIADREQLGGSEIVDNRIVRGEKGRQILMCMPRDAYAAIQRKKTEANDRLIGDSQRTKDEIAQAAAATFGDEAADFIHGKVFGDVEDSRSLETLDDPAALPHEPG